MRFGGVAFGYRIEGRGGAIGTLRRVRGEDGQCWACEPLDGAPVPEGPERLRDAARVLISMAKGAVEYLAHELAMPELSGLEPARRPMHLPAVRRTMQTLPLRCALVYRPVPA